MDEYLRELERKASTGDVDAQEKLIRELMKMTGASENQIRRRFQYPSTYGWVRDAIANQEIYYISEFIGPGHSTPKRTWAKFYTIRASRLKRGLELDSLWPIFDFNYTPAAHDEIIAELENIFWFYRVERHPWTSYAFRGSSVEDIINHVFNFFGHRVRGGMLRPLMQIVPYTYHSDWEHGVFDEDPGDDDDDEDDGIDELLESMREERDELLRQLEEQGGRNIELAERIDALNEAIEDYEDEE